MQSPEARDNGNVDRRAFLIGAGGALLTLASGCGSAATTQEASSGVRSGARIVKAPKGAPSTLQQAIRGHVFQRGQPGFTAAAHV
jgi:hypothetical protein